MNLFCTFIGHTLLVYTACRVSLHIVCQWPCVDVVTQKPKAKWCILCLLWATMMVCLLLHVQTFVFLNVLLHVLVIFKPWVCGKLMLLRLLAHHANSKFFKLLLFELVNQNERFRIISKSKLFCSCFVCGWDWSEERKKMNNSELCPFHVIYLIEQFS